MAVKLFVGGLSFSTTNEGLREAFVKFGAVESARVMTDRETGRSRGFAFVEMATEEEAERAIAGLNGTMLDGRTIRLDKAMPRGTGPVRPAGFRGGPGGGPPRPGAPPRPGYGPGRGGGYGDRPAAPPMEEQRGRGGQRRGRKPERGGDQRPGKPAGGRPTKQRRSGDRGRRTWEDL